MGVVYRARQISLGRTVALKVVAQSLVGDPGFRARFQREARAAAALSHPNIVSIHEARTLDGVLYIAMQWVDGGDLGHYLEKSGPMRPELASRVITQIGDALDVAHAGGLLHRDVKPANILVRDMSARLHAYLTDFGVTRPFVELQAGSRDGLTQPGHIVGTPGFLSPEQIQDRKVDGRADLYALGCVLFEALAGQPPFTGATYALMVSHTTAERPLVSDLHPKLGTAFDEVVRRAIAIEPDERFPTGRALAEALDAATQAPPPFPPIRPQPPRSKPALPDRGTPTGSSSNRLVVDLDDGSADAPVTKPRPPSSGQLPRGPGVPTTGGFAAGPTWGPPTSDVTLVPYDPSRRGRANAIILFCAALLVLGAVIAILVQSGGTPNSTATDTLTQPGPPPAPTRPLGQRERIVRVLKSFASALTRNKPDEMRARLAPAVTRTNVGGFICAMTQTGVMSYYTSTALDKLTRLSFPGVVPGDVDLTGKGTARSTVRAVINGDPARRFTYSFQHLGDGWKITDIQGPPGSCDG
jgi:serine/threonine protein kinase